MQMPTVPLAVPTQKHLDPGVTLALIQASIAAYSDFEGNQITPPANYKLVAHWTGWDGFIDEGKEEKFGLLFQSIQEPSTFIFAFRGTDSDWDVLEDLFIVTTAFAPYRGQVAPTPYVASGFYSIYNDKGGSMPQSMRQQLFTLLAQFNPKNVYVTGHSLGAALSQLFTLDLAVSMPNLTVANINFASPMVGLSSWKAAYESLPAQKNPDTATVRVYNYWDYIPALPPSDLGYTHVGAGFRTSFYVDSWYLYLLARHSVLNLQVVLQNALPRNPQVWVGTFTDQSGDFGGEMLSTAPPTGEDVNWLEKMRELEQFEQSILEGRKVLKASA